MDAGCLSARSLLLFLGYLLQAALGTTVIPLCGPGEMENCTTALIQTENSPRVAQVGITRCKPEMKDYCFHGQCVYIVDLDEHYCRCDVGFSGVRCVHSELVRQPLSKEYVALTVIVVLLFLAALSLAGYYICRSEELRKETAFQVISDLEMSTDRAQLLEIYNKCTGTRGDKQMPVNTRQLVPYRKNCVFWQHSVRLDGLSGYPSI
uniref:Proepiregulin n=1 Tax=Ficedula albicollis TaxID=59894 RepID=A0A803WGY7_FICAL